MPCTCQFILNVQICFVIHVQDVGVYTFLTKEADDVLLNHILHITLVLHFKTRVKIVLQRFVCLTSQIQQEHLCSFCISEQYLQD